MAKIVPLLGQCLRVMLDRTARQMSHLSTHLIELIEGIRAIGVVNDIFEVCNNDKNPYENRYNQRPTFNCVVTLTCDIS